jgi:hypothetical protein
MPLAMDHKELIIMKIPEENRIPIMLTALQIAMLGGLSLIFFVLVP